MSNRGIPYSIREAELFAKDPSQDDYARELVLFLLKQIRQPKKLSRKQKIEEELRASDLTAQETGRSDIEYGHHDSLPRGEHVANIRRTK